jgi:lipopolysaccharide/colanic/teichoic acid biosynthesis glycosyltransferase
MRLAITGASGRIGDALVPELRRRGLVLVLIGRDAARLAEIFPGDAVAGYDQMVSVLAGCDAVLHLAVRNNDQDGDYDAFVRDNVTLTLDVAQAARDAGVGRFILTSSTHALDEGNTGHYACSKRQAEAELANVEGIASEVIYLPAFVSDRMGGRLAVLNGLPVPMRKGLLALLKCLAPTVSVETLADAVVAPSTDTKRVVSDTQARNRLFAILKRSFDFLAAVGLLVVLALPMLAIWIAVKRQSPGPGIFAQERVGRRGRFFVCYKFRTMRVGTPNRASHEVSVSAVTEIGHWLRRTKLDETPQLFNVIAGQMSFVGPRPCLPSQVALIEARRRRGVLEMTPGITGLAQINEIDMSDPDRLSRWDERYLKLQGLVPDLKILLATVRGRGGGDRVAKEA